MSSEIYEIDGCFFNDPFSPFNDSSSTIDILQAFQEHNHGYNSPLTSHGNLDDNPLHEIDQITPTLPFSSSPPINQLENLSLNQKGISVISSNEALGFCSSEVKIEESQLHSYEYDNYFKIMQRSYSSNCFQQGKSNGVYYQPKFNGLIDTQNLDSQVVNPSDHCFSSAHIRRVCSTGDLQSQKAKDHITSQRLSSSPLASNDESSFMEEEANFKVGRYSAEERKEKILKYRAKRTQRNFNKTIKYACRKTLADNRPRIRGRFARNDEPGDPPKSTTFHHYKDDYELLWVDGIHENDDGEGMNLGRRQLFNTYSSMAQYQQQFSFIHD